MGAKHVFVETNWVVDCFAPGYFATRASQDLLRQAQEGLLHLHIPAICLSEARTVIRRKFQPRTHADPLRNYLRWVKERKEIEPADEEIVRQSLDRYEAAMLNELELLEERIATLRNKKGVEVFPLNEGMLELALSLGMERLDLHPFDHAILPAILTRGREIKESESGAGLFFCETDADLQPWDKRKYSA